MERNEKSLKRRRRRGFFLSNFNFSNVRTELGEERRKGANG